MSQFRQCGEDEILVRSTERRGRFMTSEREEMGGRVQSWVLAGEKGAAELRGTSSLRLYLVMHTLAGAEGEEGHDELARVFPGAFRPRCTVLEVPCHARLSFHPYHPGGIDLTDPWGYLEAAYRVHLEPE